MNDESGNTFSLDDDDIAGESSGAPLPEQRFTDLRTLVALVKRTHASEDCYRKAEKATTCGELKAFFSDTKIWHSSVKGELSILATSLAGSSALDKELLSHLHDDQAKSVSFANGERSELLDECLICDELLLAEVHRALETSLLPQSLHLVERQLSRVTSTVELLQQFRDNDGLVQC